MIEIRHLRNKQIVSLFLGRSNTGTAFRNHINDCVITYPSECDYTVENKKNGDESPFFYLAYISYYFTVTLHALYIFGSDVRYTSIVVVPFFFAVTFPRDVTVAMLVFCERKDTRAFCGTVSLTLM